MSRTQKITTCLWFDGNAEEAVAHYTAIFPDSGVTRVARYGDAGPGPKGSVMTIDFRLAGQVFLALNGGPQFTFTEAISLAVDCADQREVDELWRRLAAGGAEGQCGWLKDKFGLSWQIVPARLIELIEDDDAERANRVFQAMLGMRKLDIAGLERAAASR